MATHAHRVQYLIQSDNVRTNRLYNISQSTYINTPVLTFPTMYVVGHDPYKSVTVRILQSQPLPLIFAGSDQHRAFIIARSAGSGPIAVQAYPNALWITWRTTLKSIPTYPRVPNRRNLSSLDRTGNAHPDTGLCAGSLASISMLPLFQASQLFQSPPFRVKSIHRVLPSLWSQPVLVMVGRARETSRCSISRSFVRLLSTYPQSL